MLAQGRGSEAELFNFCLFVFYLLCIPVFRLAQGQEGEAEALPVCLFVLFVSYISQCGGLHKDREVRLKHFLNIFFFVCCVSQC